MAHQHYVSKFLTKPWERRRGRVLVYYDFQRDRIEEAKARDLFAQTDLHSADIERRLHELIEDPLGRLWHRVRKEGIKPITDPREVRAAHLVFLTQACRFIDQSTHASTVERKLVDVLGRDDAYLDALVSLQVNDYDLRVFSMPKDDRSKVEFLFYPQTGVIGFPVLEDPAKKVLASVTVALGIPLHPQILLAAVPKTVLEPWLAQVQPMFQAFSLGLTDECRKVVIPATVADRYDRAELVARIKILRALAKEVVPLMTRMKEIVVDAHRLVGLTT